MVVENKNNQIVVYQPEEGISSLEVRLENDTVWLTQNQMAELFQTDRTSIVKHIGNIYNSSELDEFSTCAKIAQVKIEGKRKVKREMIYYNLDVIIVDPESNNDESKYGGMGCKLTIEDAMGPIINIPMQMFFLTGSWDFFFGGGSGQWM